MSAKWHPAVERFAARHDAIARNLSSMAERLIKNPKVQTMSDENLAKVLDLLQRGVK